MSAITLMGMSGAGKTHFSAKLASWGWTHFSNDYEIAGSLGIDVSVGDLSALSDFIGQVGDEAKGGLNVAEFKHRQKLYYDAECAILDNLPIDAGTQKFVNDSTGSFCEIEDEALIARVAEQTKLVYIETPESVRAEIIQRAKDAPKPLYFPQDKFDGWLAEYCEEKMVPQGRIELFDRDDFSAWVFPKLFESRLPKYERLAAEYGVTVSAVDLHACESEAAFLELIGE